VWRAGKLSKAVLRSKDGGRCFVRIHGSVRPVQIAPNSSQTLQP
jgi:hypothetical protein